MKSARPSLLDSMVEEVLDQTGSPPIEALKNQMLTDEAGIQALDGRGVHVASHSRSHRNLTVLDDDELNDELVGSKQQLESVLNQITRTRFWPSRVLDCDSMTVITLMLFHWKSSNVDIGKVVIAQWKNSECPMKK